MKLEVAEEKTLIHYAVDEKGNEYEIHTNFKTNDILEIIKHTSKGTEIVYNAITNAFDNIDISEFEKAIDEGK